MDKVRGSLTAKLGPLPAWAWGLLLGGAIIAGRWALARRREATDVPVDDPGVSEVEGAAGGSGGGATGVPSAAPNPGSWPADPPVTPTNPDDMAPVDNQQWLSRATSIVVKSTGVAYTAVFDALSKYLAGQRVTPVEESYISRAVAAVGYPPAGAPAIVRDPGVGGGAQPPTPVQSVTFTARYGQFRATANTSPDAWRSVGRQMNASNLVPPGTYTINVTASDGRPAYTVTWVKATGTGGTPNPGTGYLTEGP